MADKSMVGKTNKFSSLKETVKNSSKKDEKIEEPRITAEQVVAAFRSFGFEPNQDGHNDVGYWTTRGQSEGAKLMEELRKKRIEENSKRDEKTKEEESTNKDKQALGRLSDQEIADLFDEYGLPKPDMEWARNNLPNDPKKIRAILEVQRKMADDMFKKHAKNSVNSISDQKMMQQSTGMGGYSGRGGPSAPMLPGLPEMGAGEGPVTPFFIGDHSIVRIANKNNPNASTLWLVDAKKKILRPFKSEAAFVNAFENPEEAEKSIVDITTKELGPGGALEGFQPMGGDDGVNDDGSMSDIEYTEGQLNKRYGKPIDEGTENRSLSILDGILSKLSQ